MPAANQAPFDAAAPFRMSSTGVEHGSGGTGVRKSSIRKSPFRAMGNDPELLAVSELPQKREALTVVTPPLVPILLVPPRIRPRPSTLIRPPTLTSAFRSAITHGTPPGGTP